MFIFCGARRFLTSVSIFSWLAAHSSASLAAPETVSTPKAGSAQRKAILNALRKPVAAFNRKNVIFTQVELSASRSYAFVSAATVDAKGKRVGPEITNGLQAFLQKNGAAWRVREWSYATDMISLDWEKKYPRAPKKLWPQNR